MRSTASRRGLRRVVVLYPEIPYGTELRTAFGVEVEARGGTISRAVGYEPDRANFAPMAKELVGRSQVEQRADWREVQKAIVKEITDPYRRAKALEKARKELIARLEDMGYEEMVANGDRKPKKGEPPEPVFLLCDGFEDCAVGVVNRFGTQPLMLYDEQKMLDKNFKDIKKQVDEAFAPKKK
jgi:hypothetical protein